MRAYAEIHATVGTDGVVRVEDLCFWSQASQLLAGQPVKVGFDPDNVSEGVVLHSPHGSRPVYATLIEVYGFLDTEAARAAACRAVCRRHLQSLAQRLGASLGEIVHQPAQANSHTLPTLLDSALKLALCNVESRIGDQRIGAIDRDKVSEQQLLESSQVILHLVEVLLEIVVHKSSLANEQEATEQSVQAHRLSGAAK